MVAAEQIRPSKYDEPCVCACAHPSVQGLALRTGQWKASFQSSTCLFYEFPRGVWLPLGTEYWPKWADLAASFSINVVERWMHVADSSPQPGGHKCRAFQQCHVFIWSYDQIQRPTSLPIPLPFNVKHIHFVGWCREKVPSSGFCFYMPSVVSRLPISGWGPPFLPN